MVPPGRQGTLFPFEGPVSPELLIDRESELDLLARRAGDRVGVRLAAPRRYGKTSLLLAHAGRLQESGWRTAHVDLSRVTDLTDVARRLGAAYAHLDAPWVRAHLSGLLARLGVSKDVRAWLLSHGRKSDVQEKHYDRNTYLPEKRTALEVWAAHLLAIQRPKGKRTASVHAIR